MNYNNSVNQKIIITLVFIMVSDFNFLIVPMYYFILIFVI